MNKIRALIDDYGGVIIGAVIGVILGLIIVAMLGW